MRNWLLVLIIWVSSTWIEAANGRSFGNSQVVQTVTSFETGGDLTFDGDINFTAVQDEHHEFSEYEASGFSFFGLPTYTRGAHSFDGNHAMQDVLLLESAIIGAPLLFSSGTASITTGLTTRAGLWSGGQSLLGGTQNFVSNGINYGWGASAWNTGTTLLNTSRVSGALQALQAPVFTVGANALGQGGAVFNLGHGAQVFGMASLAHEGIFGNPSPDTFALGHIGSGFSSQFNGLSAPANLFDDAFGFGSPSGTPVDSQSFRFTTNSDGIVVPSTTQAGSIAGGSSPPRIFDDLNQPTDALGFPIDDPLGTFIPTQRNGQPLPFAAADGRQNNFDPFTGEFVAPNGGRVTDGSDLVDGIDGNPDMPQSIFDIEDWKGVVETRPRIRDNVTQRNPNWASTNAGDTSANSTILRQELGIPDGSGTDAHHIVMSTSEHAAGARQILDDFQIDINSSSNGIELNNTRLNGNPDLEDHVGRLHTKAAMDDLTNRLDEAASTPGSWADKREAIQDALDNLANGISEGTWPPN